MRAQIKLLFWWISFLSSGFPFCFLRVSDLILDVNESTFYDCTLFRIFSLWFPIRWLKFAARRMQREREASHPSMQIFEKAPAFAVVFEPFGKRQSNLAIWFISFQSISFKFHRFSHVFHLFSLCKWKKISFVSLWDWHLHLDDYLWQHWP